MGQGQTGHHKHTYDSGDVYVIDTRTPHITRGVPDSDPARTSSQTTEWEVARPSRPPHASPVRRCFCRYDGEFLHGKRSGHGTYTTVSGLRYEGEWKNDAREGYGICTYVSKDIDGSSQWTGTYEGEWKANLKSGTGTYNYAGQQQERWVLGQSLAAARVDGVCIAQSPLTSKIR